MKIFAIRDETDQTGQDLAYLFYYEATKQFFIELPEGADPWQTPLLLSSFARRGETSVNFYWSRLWVQQRIVPPDRQNIAQVLRDNGLKEYDEYGLLMLAMGRCAQDDYYLVPIREDELPTKITGRAKKRVEEVVCLSDRDLLVAFRDGTIRKCDMTDYFSGHRSFAVLMNHPEYMADVKVQVGGHGIFWDENLFVPDYELYRMGKKIPLSLDELRQFALGQIIDAAIEGDGQAAGGGYFAKEDPAQRLFLIGIHHIVSCHSGTPVHPHVQRRIGHIRKTPLRFIQLR